MYQDLLTEHIGVPAVFGANAYLANANRNFRNIGTIGNLRQDMVGILNGTAVAGDWLSVGCMVSDPEQRGPMVLSYDLTFMGNVAPTGIFGCLIDRQAAAPTGVGTIYQLSLIHI